MTRRQINLRISEVTQGQLDDLAARGYTITTAVTVALDRMWREEVADKVQKGENDGRQAN